MTTPTPWTPVTESLPPTGKPVLVCYRNSHGNLRRVRACWIAENTQIADDDSESSVYNEQDDMFYDPPGWYEQMDNWDEYSGIVIHEGTPSHWCDLPEAPEDA